MKSMILKTVFSVALIASSSFANAASDNNTVIALMTPALTNPVTGKQFPAPIKICNDAKMACIPGVDTCCSGNACPSDGVCP